MNIAIKYLTQKKDRLLVELQGLQNELEHYLKEIDQLRVRISDTDKNLGKIQRAIEKLDNQ